uniref:MAPK regulated corepressor interacting protein 2 n=1 Tax=Zonotrichia albicollis TaxID=44394 RepID=A0A8D2M3U6_ZONAL
MARGPHCCCSRSQPLRNVTRWPTRRTSALSMKVRAQGPWGSSRGSWSTWSPSPAPAPAPSPRPGHFPPLLRLPLLSRGPLPWEPVPNPPGLVPSPAWQQVEQQLDSSRSGDSACGPVQYVEKTPNPGLKNFVPIDLEDWWAQQFLAKIENSS